jgi:hypothetical protein
MNRENGFGNFAATDFGVLFLPLQGIVSRMSSISFVIACIITTFCRSMDIF